MKALLVRHMVSLVISCLNSRLESTGLYWREQLGIPPDYHGPFK